MSEEQVSTPDGTLYLIKPASMNLISGITDIYSDLVKNHGAENVLVIKRQPAGTQTLSEKIADNLDVPVKPRVESLPGHASKVLEEYDATIDRLSYEERIELLDLVIRQSKHEIPGYLNRITEEESMRQEVGQVLLRITRQGLNSDDIQGSSVDEYLEYLVRTNERFHEALHERGLIERAAVVPQTTELLQENADGLRDSVSDSYSALLAVEFEEFRSIDRQYISELARDAECVCIGETSMSVNRVETETGSYPALAPDWLTIESLEPTSDYDTPDHAPITRFLGLGEGNESTGRARFIEGKTFRDQLQQIAAEIRVLDQRGYAFDEIAVATPSAERAPDTRDGLREAGIPTQEIGTNTLREDPIVNELYAFISLKADHETETALDRLNARCEYDVLTLVEECNQQRLDEALKHWIVKSDLKNRIVEEEKWVDARKQFRNVGNILDILGFIESTDLMGSTWEKARQMVDRAIRYDASHVHTEETKTPDGGVTIAPISEYKYNLHKIVFVTDLIDNQYPGKHRLGNLFPTEWVKRMDTYPAVTNPSFSDIKSTFPPCRNSENLQSETFTTYYNQLERRRLAIGSRAATETLYFCTYQQESAGLGRSFNKSRYLAKIREIDTLELIDRNVREETMKIQGEEEALERVLREPHGELERILQEASTGGEVNLAETEALFQEIQMLLQQDEVDEDIREAVRTQFEFAEGEVMRDG